MDLITCSECGKHYDYDKEEFCPKCGVYNPSSKRTASMRVRTSARPAARPAVSRAYPAQQARPSARPPQGGSGRSRQKQSGPRLSQIILILVVLYFLISFLYPFLRVAILF